MPASRFFEGEDMLSKILPPVKHFRPTFDDNSELEFVTHRIHFETSGTLHYESQRGDEITQDFTEGMYPLSIRKIYSSGTTFNEDEVLCLV